MANPNGHPETLTAPRFKPGHSGNRAGKPPGTRNGLTSSFIRALAQDFDAHGSKAIEACRTQNPAAYIRAITALCPKEVEIKRPLQEMEDAELIAAVRALEGFLAARANEAGAGAPLERAAVN